MRITTTAELKAFLQMHFQNLTDAQYIDLMSHALGVYEHSKPKSLEQLLKQIDVHDKFLSELPSHYELPLFFIEQ